MRSGRCKLLAPAFASRIHTHDHVNISGQCGGCRMILVGNVTVYSCHVQVDHLTKFVMGDSATSDADEQAQQQRRGNRRDTWAPGVIGVCT